MIFRSSLIVAAAAIQTNAFTVPSRVSLQPRGATYLRMADKPGIEVVSQPSAEFLEKKDVFSWGKWSCPPSKFPWTYDSTESCYLLQGQVTVTPTDGRKAATFGKGDFVTFPSGMSCTWDVSEGVEKHYIFY